VVASRRFRNHTVAPKQSPRNAPYKARADRLARELKDCEGRFRAVVEQSTSAIYVIQDNKIAYANPRMRQIFGYLPGDAIDRNPLAHINEAEWPMVTEQMRLRMSGEREAAYTITAVRKDGSEFQLGVHATRATYRGRPAIIAIGQDITDKLQAEEIARQYVGQLELAMRSAVEAMSVITQISDPYTYGHERRVGAIAAAVAIAEELGFDPYRIEGIRIAGFMHDIGKISVPAEILAKPGKLTYVEFQLVKRHSQDGYQILKGINFPWPVAEVALQHHERLDGSGYPRGLKADAILMEARIMSVADVLEATASHRPYRPALGIDRALSEVEQGRGILYDPVVVDACLKLFREKGYQLPE
jgi:PAS domain S-box-containing protein